MRNTCSSCEKLTQRLILIAVLAICSVPIHAAPAFSAPRDLSIFTVVAGSPVSFTVTASDPGYSVTLSSGAIPSGASFDAATGDFTWTPTASPSQAGFYTIVFFANDTAGQSVIQVTINVISSVLTSCSLVVTSSGDSGSPPTVPVGASTTLRQAINCADTHPGNTHQAITFSISGSGPQTLMPATPLPNITVPVIIDGYSQPSASPNTSLSGDNAMPLIVLNGTSLASGGCGPTTPPAPPATGLMINPGVANSSIIQGLVINNFCTGISVSGNLVRIRGNFIGTDSSGMLAQPNVNDGVDIFGIFNTIGGNSPGASNLISGNGSNGIALFSTLPPACGSPGPACSSPTSTLIQGNFIGTDATGASPLGNGTPPDPSIPHSGSGAGVVLLDGANKNTIEGNVISYNGTGGVDIDVSFNNPGGSLGLPNNNKVVSNTVAFNGRNGVRISYGTGNTISQNSIYGNGDPASGIKLGPTEGLDLNQSCNVPSSPPTANNSQNFPVLNPNPLTNSASGSPITGTLNSVAGTTFTIEFFVNNAAALVPLCLTCNPSEPAVAQADPIGFGEGQAFIGSTTVTTDGTCNGSFSFTPPTPLAPGQVVTATATNTTTGDTSEFSNWGNTVAVASNVNPSAFGQSVTITASLSPGNIPYTTFAAALSAGPSDFPAAQGSVTFQEGATVLSGPTPLTSLWQASFSTSSLSAGSHTITAYYTDTTVPPTFISSAGNFTQTVNPAPATIALGNLLQPYDGTPKSVTATTTPGFCGPASVTYNGSSTPPINIGSYAVVASVTNSNCTGPNATGTLIIFAYAPGGGSFVLGDLSSAPQTSQTFWGAQWAKVNSLSGGSAPSSFKGFAAQTSPAPPMCGGMWTSDPGNSSHPPSAVPAYMAVIVSSSITKSGSTLMGDIPRIVILNTNPGYAPDPGHAGTGTIVATLCH